MTATVSTVKDESYYEKDETKNAKAKAPRRDTENYYSESEKVIGRWLGAGAEQLGLTGDIHAGEFTKVMNGIHPETNERMWKKKRVAYNGTDMTCSATKDFSVLWAIGDDDLKDKLLQVHEKAVDRAVAKASKGLYQRLNKNNDKAFGVMPIIASFNHTTARPTDKRPDPQIHAHNVFVRKGLIKTDNGFKVVTIDNHSLFQGQKLYGATYRAELANGLRELGFEIKRVKEEVEQTVLKTSKDGVVEEFQKMRVDSFQVKNLSRELVKNFSNRSEAINKIAKDSGNTSSLTKANIAKDIRRKKEVWDESTLHNVWKKEAKELFNFDSDSVNALRTYEKTELGNMSKNEYRLIKDSMYKGQLFEGKLRLRLAEYEQTSGINADDLFQSIQDRGLITRVEGFRFDINFELKEVDVMDKYISLKRKTINDRLIENNEFISDNIYILPILMIDLIKESYQNFQRMKLYEPNTTSFRNIAVSLKPVFSNIMDDEFVSLSSKIANKEQKLLMGNKSEAELIRIRLQIDALYRQLAEKKAEKNKVKWISNVD